MFQAPCRVLEIQGRRTCSWSLSLAVQRSQWCVPCAQEKSSNSLAIGWLCMVLQRRGNWRFSGFSALAPISCTVSRSLLCFPGIHPAAQPELRSLKNCDPRRVVILVGFSVKAFKNTKGFFSSEIHKSDLTRSDSGALKIT